MGNFSSPYDNSSLGIGQVKSSEWMWIVYTYGARVLYPCTFTTIRRAIDPNVHLQILRLSLHQIICKAIGLNVHLQILQLFLCIRVNLFGDSSSALFTKNKTCLNVFVGPGDGGLYPQFNGQRYLKMSDTDIWAKTDSLDGGGNIYLIRDVVRLILIS